jgi:hypothetical protein
MDELQDIASEVMCVIERVTAGEDFPDDHFDHLALRLAMAQKNANPILAAYWKEVGPQRWKSWRDIPALTVEAFKHWDLTSIPDALRTRVFYSSGTSGQQRSRHWHHEASLQLYRAALKPWFARHVLPQADAGASGKWLMVSFTPPPALAPHSSLVEMMATVMESWGLPQSVFLGQANSEGDWVLDLPKTTAVLQSVSQQGQPVVLMGTAFNFVHWLDYLDSQGARIPLPPGSCLMETGGYKGRSRAVPPAELHATLCRRLALHPSAIVREYGMCELSSQAYDWTALSETASPRRFRFPPWVRFRVLSPENGTDCPPGVPGLLCVYDLANVWSVLAIQTADLAVAEESGFELMGRAASVEPRGCSLMVTE